MKKLIIVNSDMKIGGVQKSLHNLLWEISSRYDITLLLFHPKGAYLNQLPPNIKIIPADGSFLFFGVGQGEFKKTSPKYWLRGLFALLTKIFGRAFAMRLMLPFQKAAPGEYDYAISFLHNEAPRAFYGGTNEFVLRKVRAKKKVAFIHCDYETCGANTPGNNQIYGQFDAIAACSGGCRKVFLKVVPQLESKCFPVHNCTRFAQVRQLADMEPVAYDGDHLTVLTVARLSPVKGVHRGLEAVAYASGQGVPVHYHIVGDGKTKAALEARVRELGLEGKVFFHGEQENPYRYMKNADLLLVTSYHEAAPLVVDEAMCLGVPVLSVQTTSSEEMILQRGGGWVCRNEQKALNEQLLQVLRNRAELESKKSHLRQVNWDNHAALKEFMEMLGDGHEHN